MQNIENIFTKEELDEFVKQKRLQKVKLNNQKHYIKYGSYCKKRFIKLFK